MAHYLFQGSFTAQAWKTLLANPVNRLDVLVPVMKKLGGKQVSSWFALGGHDFLMIAEFPDSSSAAAYSLAVNAGGAVKSFTTTALLTMEEGIAAMKKGAASGYRPPGK